MQTVLVIEDDKAIREAVVDILELEGFHAISAEDGVRGVSLARKERPALIVCDIVMPYLDGYGVLSELRKYTDTATIPFIFLTARTTTSDIRYGMNLGVDDYLTKPFRAEELVRTIQARLDRQARLSEKLHRRMDELHSNLLSVLPHELNTPLHGVLAGIEFLREELHTLEPADVDELLWIIQKSAHRMRRLVSNTLLHNDLKLMEGDPVNVRKEPIMAPVDVALTIQLIVEQEAEIVTRQSDLLMTLADASIAILPAHISKIAEEIINNAFKYSTPGTPVEVHSHTDGDLYCLSIKDYGRGMSSEEIASICAFQQFQRQQFEQQGLGLGLVIVQRLLELYQGKLEITSKYGEYTLCRVFLPTAPFVTES